MLRGRQRDHWNHTAHILAMLANVFRDRRQRPVGPAEFHPFARQQRTATLAEIARLAGLRERPRGDP